MCDVGWWHWSNYISYFLAGFFTIVLIKDSWTCFHFYSHRKHKLTMSDCLSWNIRLLAMTAAQGAAVIWVWEKWLTWMKLQFKSIVGFLQLSSRGNYMNCWNQDSKRGSKSSKQLLNALGKSCLRKREKLCGGKPLPCICPTMPQSLHDSLRLDAIPAKL